MQEAFLIDLDSLSDFAQFKKIASSPVFFRLARNLCLLKFRSFKERKSAGCITGHLIASFYGLGAVIKKGHLRPFRPTSLSVRCSTIERIAKPLQRIDRSWKCDPMSARGVQAFFAVLSEIWPHADPLFIHACFRDGALLLRLHGRLGCYPNDDRGACTLRNPSRALPIVRACAPSC
jgi:hypothetical protein